MKNITDLESLLTHNLEAILYQCIAGSLAYGTAHAKSDEDIRGIFILPRHHYLSITEPLSMVSDARGDVVYYSLHRFIQLASHANPNIIELLFMPDDCIQLMTPTMEAILKVRHLFITKQAYESHVGYALAQIKKARGQNKWINNPQPRTLPKREDYCWIVLRENNQDNHYPFRPVCLQTTAINLSECHVASLEHCPNVYRLYLIGEKAKGVFRNGIITCESIAKEDENDQCIGLLIFNKSSYECSLKDYHNYWEWRKNRNERRWLIQETGYLDYDAKNMMHMFRLLLSGENILREGSPIVRFEGENLEFLRDILQGKFQYNELIALANEKIDDLSKLNQNCSLPEHSDLEKLNRLLYQLTESWENRR
jgi:predicted nucleotidyltransferase